MRVHEFAKQHNLTSKDLLDRLKEEGFDVKNHMSVLSPEALSYLEQKPADQKKVAAPKSEPIHQPVQASAPVIEKHASIIEKNPKTEPVPAQEKPSSPVKERPAMHASSHPNSAKSSRSNHRFPSRAGQQAAVEPEEQVINRAPFTVEPMTLNEFAQRTNIQVSQIIISLLKEGKAYVKNQLLSEQDVTQLCRLYELEIVPPVRQKSSETLANKGELSTENTQRRLPVVVIMGHVDHGKTTLLDFIRKTRVAAKEKGGITQHLGAYQVSTGHGDLVFLDTPGHEAFSKIRKRGASIADIAILLVAADDGVMPQTVESIKAIKALDVPVIVAINKVDRVEPQRLETIKRQLTQHDILPEEWGGQVMCIPISAKEGTGVDYLLEMIALQAEVLDLKASPSAPVRGYVLESKMLKGRGAVATVICQQGTLRVGDFFKAGAVSGKVSSMTDSAGRHLEQVSASVPVLVAGFTESPEVGSTFEVIAEVDYRKVRNDGAAKNPSLLAHRLANTGDLQKFNIILKADTHSSLEAILDALKKISKTDIKEIVLIRAGIGDITESDALLAESTGATIIGFSVKAEQNALNLARNADVAVHLFDIIYKLLEQFEVLATREKEIKRVLTKVGKATVLKVFDIKKLGVIAGCIVNEGRFSDKGVIAIIRNKREIARGKIKSLQRDKKTVKEVHAGFECAFIVEGFEEWEVDDVAECYLNIVV